MNVRGGRRGEKVLIVLEVGSRRSGCRPLGRLALAHLLGKRADHLQGCQSVECGVSEAGLPAAKRSRVRDRPQLQPPPPSQPRLHPPRSSLTPAPHLLDHLSVHPAPHPAARHHAHKDPAKEGLQAGRGRSMGTRRSLALRCQWRQQASTTGIPNQLPVRLHSRGSPTSSPTPCPAAATIRTLNLAGALPACTVLPICMTPALGPSVTPPIMGAGPPNTPAGWETGAQVGRKDQLRRLTEQEL